MSWPYRKEERSPLRGSRQTEPPASNAATTQFGSGWAWLVLDCWSLGLPALPSCSNGCYVP